ncbi:MAG: hypothetical protein M0R22_10910 [Dehalococcoidia bacterium]|nr:hypothetical protein [Dehalococcoidia bacterium]
MLSIEIHGLDKLVAKFGAGARPVIRRVTRAVAEQVLGTIAQYPGPVHHPIQWTSAKQRAAYFAKRRKAGLPMGYTRGSDSWSQKLGPSASTVHSATQIGDWKLDQRGDLEAVVGTGVTYAPWVQSAAQQQPMHKASNWITDERAIARVEQSGAIERIIADAVKQEGW